MNYYTEEGTLESPGYPGGADHQMECDYLIKIADAQAIRVVLEYFDLEDQKDVLLVGEGPEIMIEYTPGPNVVQLTGNLSNILSLENRTFIFNTNQIWLSLYTDRNIPSNGFVITWDSGMYNVQR